MENNNINGSDSGFSSVKVFFVIIILGVLGFNVFNFLAQGTDEIIDVGKQATGVAAEGVKKQLI